MPSLDSGQGEGALASFGTSVPVAVVVVAGADAAELDVIAEHGALLGRRSRHWFLGGYRAGIASGSREIALTGPEIELLWKRADPVVLLVPLEPPSNGWSLHGDVTVWQRQHWSHEPIHGQCIPVASVQRSVGLYRLPPPSCGNFVVDPGEECDGRQSGCNEFCTFAKADAH